MTPVKIEFLEEDKAKRLAEALSFHFAPVVMDMTKEQTEQEETKSA